MESKRVKSAWEIALERAERLGSLSSEELKAKQEEEAREIGRGLATRCLAGVPGRDLRAELARHEESRRLLIMKEAVAVLTAALSPFPDEKTRRAMEGLRLLIGEDALHSLEVQVASVRREYDETLTREGKRLASRIRASGEAELRGRGALGSGLKINVPASPEWQAAMERINAEYRKRLDDLGRRIAAMVA